MPRHRISAAERELIRSAVTSGAEIVSLESAPNFRFVPAAMMSDVPTVLSGPPSKRTLSFKRKPHMRNVKNWSPQSLTWGPDDLRAPMRGDPPELTQARRAYADGDPEPMREWLAKQPKLAPFAGGYKKGTMTPDEFKAIRKRAGLTQSQLALRLRISDKRAVRYWETGQRAISGPVSLLMEMLDRGDLTHA